MLTEIGQECCPISTGWTASGEAGNPPVSGPCCRPAVCGLRFAVHPYEIGLPPVGEPGLTENVGGLPDSSVQARSGRGTMVAGEVPPVCRGIEER